MNFYPCSLSILIPLFLYHLCQVFAFLSIDDVFKELDRVISGESKLEASVNKLANDFSSNSSENDSLGDSLTSLRSIGPELEALTFEAKSLSTRLGGSRELAERVCVSSFKNYSSYIQIAQPPDT